MLIQASLPGLKNPSRSNESKRQKLAVSQLLPFLISMRYLLRHIRNHQLRTVGRRSAATVQAEIIGNGIVVIIQFEAQPDLRQTAVGKRFMIAVTFLTSRNLDEMLKM